ncbi:MAG: response regulator of zinc sigma-54-dependent two-component system [Verrucomicrobiaceae bacterium]|nr:response regulator of zinc sigma-54-dependent two-component system [Verrucomicrobiaceae bacterium]
MQTPRWYGKKNVPHRPRFSAQNAPDFKALLGELTESTQEGPSLLVRVGESIADVERKLIIATLAEYEGNKVRAASVLGVSLKTIYNRLNELRVRDEEPGQ